MNVDVIALVCTQCL